MHFARFQKREVISQAVKFIDSVIPKIVRIEDQLKIGVLQGLKSKLKHFEYDILAFSLP